ncbi:MAG: hypothetical protein JO039_08665 [Solirubrobacterales bacterium]|nr:hypothetical protein [Solirubrobacterales bacterium]
MAEQTIAAPRIRERRRDPGREAARRFARRRWTAALAVVLLASTLFVVLTAMRPAFDAYGWLVWGRQALHWDLNTNAAPSWKPLTFLFTFAYSVVGRGALWLWMVTAVGGAFAAAIFAAKLAYRLTGPASGRPYAPVVATVFAGLGVLGIDGYWQLILSATSDPMDVTLCLAAIDCHLSGRRRLAWAALVLLSLGRPEAWPVTALYALWAWRAIPSMRVLVAAGIAVIPVLWFGIPALTSRSWKISSDVALDSTSSIAGNKFLGVWHHFLSVYELPMQLAGLFAVILALARRERTWLMLIGASLLWVATEIGFALHGFAAPARYLWEPAAVMIVLAGSAIGWVLANAPRLMLLRWVAIGAVIAVVVALAPHARGRVQDANTSIVLVRNWGRQIDRLRPLIAREGGRKRILACGQAVTVISYQSIVAWELELNVIDVGWNPPRWIDAGQPMVLFWPQGAGWIVQIFHIPAARRAACNRLQTQTAFS